MNLISILFMLFIIGTITVITYIKKAPKGAFL